MKIHLVKTRLVNSYVIEDNHQIMVVDVATNCEKYLLHEIENNLGIDPKQISLVLCTHDDIDHSGGVLRFAHYCDANVGIPYASYSNFRKFIHNPDGIYHRTISIFQEVFRSRMWDMYMTEKKQYRVETSDIHKYSLAENLNKQHREKGIKPNKDKFVLKDQHTLPFFDDWKAIHTPGHSWDSCCYFHEKSGSLITGDTLLGSRKKNQLVFPAIYSSPIQLRRSLRKLDKLNISSYYPGHGQAFHGSGLLKPLCK